MVRKAALRRSTALLASALVVGIGSHSTAAETVSFVGWMAMPQVLYVQATIELEHGAVTGWLEPFAEAPFGFDASYGRVEISEGQQNGQRISFVAEMPFGSVVFDGRIEENVIVGALGLPGSPEFTLRQSRIPESAERRDRMGVYEFDDGNRVLLTEREFGHVRMIPWRGPPRCDTLFWITPDRLETMIRTANLNTPQSIRFSGNSGEDDTIMLTVESQTQRGRRLDILREEPIAFESDGAQLQGTLYLPETNGPHPAVVMVHGSGPIYRTALLDKLSYFIEAGYAVLVYDKRGTGRSSGQWKDASFSDLAQDAAAALDAAAAHRDINSVNIGIFGHSEAGWVIPEAVHRAHVKPSFGIIASGGGASYLDVEPFQKELELNRSGVPQQDIQRAMSFYRTLVEDIARGEGASDSLAKDYDQIKNEPWFSILDLPIFEQLPPLDDETPGIAQWRLKLIYPWDSFASELRAPVLVMLGSVDNRVPHKIALQGWRRVLEGPEPWKRRSRIVVMDGKPHSLRSESGIPDAEYVHTISNWLVEHRH